MNLSSLSWILIIVSTVLALGAQAKVHYAFKKAMKKKTSAGLTGAEVADKILKSEGLDLPINKAKGHLSDNYNPIKKTVNLSEPVHSQTSIASLAVAAHEVGHAIQHKEGYHWLVMRTTLYPVVGFSSWLAPILIIAGFFFTGIPYLLDIGIILFAATVFFTLITLPVEFDASKRAMIKVQELGLVGADESRQVKKVLDAAALTYVAAAATAILELVRLILIAQSRD